ncbi:MAG: hypothetical protein JWQ78_183 [Sediminibacterium sp.]|nr:hypothetical protein [Sediminibacterium sp.]
MFISSILFLLQNEGESNGIYILSYRRSNRAFAPLREKIARKGARAQL